MRVYKGLYLKVKPQNIFIDVHLRSCTNPECKLYCIDVDGLYCKQCGHDVKYDQYSTTINSVKPKDLLNKEDYTERYDIFEPPISCLAKRGIWVFNENTFWHKKSKKLYDKICKTHTINGPHDLIEVTSTAMDFSFQDEAIEAALKSYFVEYMVNELKSKYGDDCFSWKYGIVCYGV